MPRHTGKIAANAVLLRNDSVGVSTEITPRKIQQNSADNGFYCSLNPNWLDQVGLARKSAETLHSVSVGARPVIVQNPAIIIQPAEKIDIHGATDDTDDPEAQNGEDKPTGDSPW